MLSLPAFLVDEFYQFHLPYMSLLFHTCPLLIDHFPKKNTQIFQRIISDKERIQITLYKYSGQNTGNSETTVFVLFYNRYTLRDNMSLEITEHLQPTLRG
jgi:hypothetical protein